MVALSSDAFIRAVCLLCADDVEVVRDVVIVTCVEVVDVEVLVTVVVVLKPFKEWVVAVVDVLVVVG